MRDEDREPESSESMLERAKGSLRGEEDDSPAAASGRWETCPRCGNDRLVGLPCVACREGAPPAPATDTKPEEPGTGRPGEGEEEAAPAGTATTERKLVVNLSTPYQSPAMLARILQVLFGGWAALVGVMIAFDVQWQRLLGAVIDDPFAASFADIQRFDQTAETLDGIWGVAYLLTAITFIAWTSRVYRNLEPLGVRGQRYKNGWAIGGWFVPFLNLAAPKQITDDVWRGSDPESGPVVVIHPSRRVPILLHAWWAVFLISSVVWGVGGVQDPQDFEGFRRNVTVDLVGTAVTGLSALLAFWVVTELTRRQIARAAALGVPDPATAASARFTTPGPAIVAGAMVLAVAGAFGLAFGPFDAELSAATVAETDATAGTVATTLPEAAFGISDLAVGTCFDVAPSGATLTTRCGDPHTFEMVAHVDLAGLGDYPGEDELFDLAMEVCIPRLASYVGAGFRESGLDIITWAPSEASWQDDDTTVQCAAATFDLSPLTASVRNSGGIDTGDVRWWNWEVGECYDDATSPPTVTSCAAPHDNEVYAIVEHPAPEGVPYPGDATWDEDSDAACVAAFTEYVGAPIASTWLEIYWWLPPDRLWSAGERWIICALYDYDLDKLTGSMKGTGPVEPGDLSS